MAISELLQNLLDEKDWNLTEAAQHSKVCRRTLQEMLYHNETNLTVRTIKKLAAAFKVDPELIFRALL